MNLVCFRLAPKQVSADQYDNLNAQLQQYLLTSQENSSAVFLSLPTYQSQRWLKAVLLNPYTSSAIIAHLFSCIDVFIKETLDSVN